MSLKQTKIITKIKIKVGDESHSVNEKLFTFTKNHLSECESLEGSKIKRRNIKYLNKKYHVKMSKN